MFQLSLDNYDFIVLFLACYDGEAVPFYIYTFSNFKGIWMIACACASTCLINVHWLLREAIEALDS